MKKKWLCLDSHDELCPYVGQKCAAADNDQKTEKYNVCTKQNFGGFGRIFKQQMELCTGLLLFLK